MVSKESQEASLFKKTPRTGRPSLWWHFMGVFSIGEEENFSFYVCDVVINCFYQYGKLVRSSQRWMQSTCSTSRWRRGLGDMFHITCSCLVSLQFFIWVWWCDVILFIFCREERSIVSPSSWWSPHHAPASLWRRNLPLSRPRKCERSRHFLWSSYLRPLNTSIWWNREIRGWHSLWSVFPTKHENCVILTHSFPSLIASLLWFIIYIKQET